MLLKNLALVLIVSGIVFLCGIAAHADTVFCKLDFDARYTSFEGFRSPRKNHDKTIQTRLNLDVSNSLNLSNLISDPDINAYFNLNISLKGSVYVDPITNQKKLFIGLYDGVRDSVIAAQTSTDLKKYLNLFVGTYSNPMNSKEGKFNINCKIEKESKQKNKISNLNAKTKLNSLNPENNIEQFSCDVVVKRRRSGRVILEEKNKQVYLGYSNQYNRTESINTIKRDLQPLIEDLHFERATNNLRIMANIYEDPETKTPKMLLGVYRMQRLYQEELHAGYWLPEYQPQSGPFYFGMPMAEVVSTSGYIDLKTTIDVPAGFITIDLSCELK